MKFFLAGIMQGSRTEASVHDQAYRQKIANLLATHFPGATVYDPYDNHSNSIAYDDTTGRKVFFDHNAMCRTVDVLLAFVPGLDGQTITVGIYEVDPFDPDDLVEWVEMEFVSGVGTGYWTTVWMEDGFAGAGDNPEYKFVVLGADSPELAVQ